MEQLLILNPENAEDSEVETYSVREACRAIVVDKDGLIALLHVSKKGYFKLPGGGIEIGENLQSALRRECLEEVGCAVEILFEIGSIVEYRRMHNLKQTSYCFLTKVQGEKQGTAFTAEELNDGFEIEWFSHERALEVLHQCKTTDFEGGEYIVPRDLVFLEASEEYIRRI